MVVDLRTAVALRRPNCPSALYGRARWPNVHRIDGRMLNLCSQIVGYHLGCELTLAVCSAILMPKVRALLLATMADDRASTTDAAKRHRASGQIRCKDNGARQ